MSRRKTDPAEVAVARRSLLERCYASGPDRFYFQLACDVLGEELPKRRRRDRVLIEALYELCAEAGRLSAFDEAWERVKREAGKEATSPCAVKGVPMARQP
jgi:hypothetical protein